MLSAKSCLNTLKSRIICKRSISKKVPYKPIQMENNSPPPSITEDIVGIQAYTNNDIKGFIGIHKQRFSDFIVREIDRNGNVATINDIFCHDVENLFKPKQSASNNNNNTSETTEVALQTPEDLFAELDISLKEMLIQSNESNIQYFTEEYYNFIRLLYTKSKVRYSVYVYTRI